MNKLYRIYVGARNQTGRFSEKDIKTMEDVLNRYFTAWSWMDSNGYWMDKREESKIITVTLGATQQTEAAGKTPVQSCARQLRGHFEQDAVMIEEAGEAVLVFGKGAAAV